MRIRKTILSIFFFCVFASTSNAEDVVNQDELYFYKDNYQTLCSKVLERNKNGTLDKVTLGSIKDNYKKSFFADIDNDGKNEEFQFFPTRSYMQLEEIVNGERRGLPAGDARTVFYNGSYIIYIGQQFYLLHMATQGPLEVQKLSEPLLIERDEKEQDSHVHQLYDVDTICKYYKP